MGEEEIVVVYVASNASSLLQSIWPQSYHKARLFMFVLKKKHWLVCYFICIISISSYMYLLRPLLFGSMNRPRPQDTN